MMIIMKIVISSNGHTNSCIGLIGGLKPSVLPNPLQWIQLNGTFFEIKVAFLARVRALHAFLSSRLSNEWCTCRNERIPHRLCSAQNPFVSPLFQWSRLHIHDLLMVNFNKKWIEGADEALPYDAAFIRWIFMRNKEGIYEGFFHSATAPTARISKERCWKGRSSAIPK